MPTTGDVNSCLTIPDPVAQLNCVRAAFGYPKVAATSETTPPCDGTIIAGRCVSKEALMLSLIGGAIALFLLTRKK